MQNRFGAVHNVSSSPLCVFSGSFRLSKESPITRSIFSLFSSISAGQARRPAHRVAMQRRRRDGMPGMERHGRNFVMRVALLVTVLAAGVAALPAVARAQVGSDRYSSIVVDAAPGNVREAPTPDAPRHPASLAKLMTLYMAFEALRDRRITAEQLVPVSAHAASMEPSKLGLLPGTRLTVEEAILGLATRAANDASSALVELC